MGIRSLPRAMTLAALIMGGPAAADPGAIQGVIDQQIDAFRADDFETAFTYAAPGIRSMFGTPSNFGRMVRQGYPMVWRPESVEYLDAAPRGPGWEQDVLVTDSSGRIHRLRYSMVQTQNGWRIAGVSLLRTPDVGA